MSVWLFVAEIVSKFILGLDILHIYEASMNLGSHKLRFWEKEL
jgi:hypothetical protein